MEKVSINKKDIEVFNFLIDMACQIRYFKWVYQYPKTIRVDTEHYKSIQEHCKYWIRHNDNNEMIFQNVIIIEDTEVKGNFMVMN